jgi:hypothetical protein
LGVDGYQSTAKQLHKSLVNCSLLERHDGEMHFAPSGALERGTGGRSEESLR